MKGKLLIAGLSAFIGIAAVVLCTTLLAGHAQATAVDAVTIRLWHPESGAYEVTLQQIVAAFETQYPTITVQVQHLGYEELRNEFETASLAGEAPEVVRMPNDAIGAWADMGIVLPVKDMFDQAFLDTFLPGALAGTSRKGILYGIPDNYGNHLMLLYNKNLVTAVPGDWGELIATAKGLTNEAIGSWGLAINIREPFWLIPFLGGYGGWVLDDITDLPTLNTPAMVNTLQFLSDLQNLHHIVPLDCDYNTADTLFKEGKAAFLVNGDWSLSGYQDAGLGFAAAAMPVIQETGLWPSPMTSGKYYMVSNQVRPGTAKWDAVSKFVEFMTGEAAQQTWLEEQGVLPSNKSVANSPIIQQDPILRGSMTQLVHGRAMPAAPELRCFWDSARAGQEGVLDGTMAPAAAAAKMQADAMACVRGLFSHYVYLPLVQKRHSVTITYWEQEGDTVDTGILDPLVNEFMAANPGICVVRKHYGNEELRIEFENASLAARAPDLLRGPNDPIGRFAMLGIVLPVREMFDPAFLDTFLPGALENGRVKGTMYGIPDVYGNHLMLLYNKNLVTQVPADWDGLIATAKDLTNEAAGTWGLAMNIREPFWLAAFLGGFGGRVLDPVTDYPTLNTPAMVNTLQFLGDLANVHQIVPPGCDYDTADTLFREGKAAFLVNGDWSLGSYLGVVDFATAAMPPINETGLHPTPMTSGKYWAISSQVPEGTAKFEAVQKFVEFMAGEHAQTVWLEQNRQLPSNKNVANSPIIQSDPILRGSMAQLTHGVAMPAAPELRCFWDSVRPGLEAVIDGTMTPADAALQMQQAADLCMEELSLSSSR